jgi:ActR/RegA family two-component response regulator
MAYSKFSLLIVDEDCRVSRLLRDRMESAFPQMRVEIAGSAAKALAICARFPPSWIVWDGLAREGCSLDEYLNCIPQRLWPKVIPISSDAAALEAAQARGAQQPLSKPTESLNAWAEAVVQKFKPLLGAKRK